MVITTQYTFDYSDKAKDCLNSVTMLHGNLQFYRMFYPEKVKSYRKDWPKNRAEYVSMQAGEFLPHIQAKDGEIICQIDCDSVMNRAFTQTELRMIETRLKKFDILSVYGAYPPTLLVRVLSNIGYPNLDASYFGGDWHGFPEFTASIMIATKETFQKLSEEYNKHFDEMTRIIPHHAGGQWLINWICYTQFKVGILPKTFQCGAWYDGCTEDDAQNAIFNHTK